MTQKNQDRLQWLGIVIAIAGIGVGILQIRKPAAVVQLPPQPILLVTAETGAERRDVVAPPEAIDDPPANAAFGYTPNPEAVADFEATQGVKAFRTTPAGQVDQIPQDVFLWQIHQQLMGVPPPEKDQNPVGSCVAFGGSTAVERSEASEIWVRAKKGQGSRSEFTHFVEEVNYAGCRVEVNGGRCPIQPNWRDKYGDGANGAWFAAWVTRYGCLPRAVYGTLDLRVYDPKLARAWQFKGVPDELEPLCAQHKVSEAARISTWTDCKRALANGYGVSICSSIGFNGQRDKNGVCTPGPHWEHCMCCDGYHTEPDGSEYGHIENSWAKTNYHKGPVGWGNPTNSGFWADAKTIQRMISGQGSVAYAFSGIKGFQARPADELWILAPVPTTRGAVARAEFRLNRKDVGPWMLSLAW